VLEDGATERGSILVGADGIHSLVRDQVFGATAATAPEGADLSPASSQGSPSGGRARADGYAAWRGLVSGETAASLGIERRSYIWLGPGRSVVLYYVSGGRLLNWIGIGRSDQAKRESWSATGSVEALLDDYAGWHPQIVGLMAATARPFITRLLDREPLPSWVNGRVVLLGDAAHAMLPYHAQGAVQSLEDAWVLARSIAIASTAASGAAGSATGDAALREALLRYQRLRLDRATQVQAYSRAAQDWYHVSDPVEIARRDERFRAVARRGAGGFSPQQEWLYTYDAEKAALGEDDAWRAMKWGG
jgi:salicylate hydroxylase